MTHRTDSRRVSHLWANGATFQGIKAAQNNNGQFYYTGRTIWSYGRHFPVATLLDVVSPDSGRVETIAIFNDSSYGITTSKHQSYARSAAHHHESHAFPLDCNLTDALERLSNGRPFDGDAAMVERAVKAHPESGAGYPLLLLTLQPVGVVGGESYRVRMARHNKAQKLLNGYRAAKVKADALAAATAAKREKESMKSAIKYALTVTRDDFTAAALAGMDSIRRYGENSGRSQNRTLKELREMHRAASSFGMVKAKAELWARVKIYKAAIAAAEAHHAAANRRSYARNQVKTFRRLAAQYAGGQAMGHSLTAREFQTWAAATNWIIWNVAPVAAVETLKATHAAIMAAMREAQSAEERAAYDKAEAARLDWLAGGPSRFHGKDSNGGALLRAVNVQRNPAGDIIGGTLETSQGADVPLTHAVKAFRMIKLCRDNARPWKSNGHRLPVGHFAVDWIGANGDFKAGCHLISWAEVERLSSLLGLDNVTAEDTTTHAGERA